MGRTHGDKYEKVDLVRTRNTFGVPANVYRSSAEARAAARGCVAPVLRDVDGEDLPPSRPAGSSSDPPAGAPPPGEPPAPSAPAMLGPDSRVDLMRGRLVYRSMAPSKSCGPDWLRVKPDLWHQAGAVDQIG